MGKWDRFFQWPCLTADKDTNQHAIADAHPGDLNRIVFPGQDYNNSRIMDFQDVVHWQNNKLDRTQNSRMGWTDLSICISGPVVSGSARLPYDYSSFSIKLCECFDDDAQLSKKLASSNFAVGWFHYHHTEMSARSKISGNISCSVGT